MPPSTSPMCRTTCGRDTPRRTRSRRRRRVAEQPDLGLSYAVKRVLLGRPLATSRLEHERLGKPTALAVFSSDNMSSVAYATEEILRVLLPAIGVLAFTYVVPISGAIVLNRSDLDLQLPPNDQGVPDRRRRVHRDEGQPRPPARAARGGGTADRLRADGQRVDRRRRPGDQLRHPVGRRGADRPGARVRLADR